MHGISREALGRLENYSWPGNVRELQNAIERAVAFARSDVIEPEDLPAFPSRAGEGLVDRARAERLTLRALQERYIEAVLEETGGDLERAADLLGVHPRTLRRRAGRRAAMSGASAA